MPTISCGCSFSVCTHAHASKQATPKHEFEFPRRATSIDRADGRAASDGNPARTCDMKEPSRIIRSFICRTDKSKHQGQLRHKQKTRRGSSCGTELLACLGVRDEMEGAFAVDARARTRTLHNHNTSGAEGQEQAGSKQSTRSHAHPRTHQRGGPQTGQVDLGNHTTTHDTRKARLTCGQLRSEYWKLSYRVCTPGCSPATSLSAHGHGAQDRHDQAA